MHSRTSNKKFHKRRNGKKSSTVDTKVAANKVSSGSNTPSADVAGENDSEQTDTESILLKYELELAWCVQQLQLSSSDVTQDESSKALKVLTSSKASMIRKRQMMHSLFGDYRTQMAKEKDKLKLDTSKATICRAKSAEMHGTVYRKKTQIPCNTISTPTGNSFINSTEKLFETFKFNFEIPK